MSHSSELSSQLNGFEIVTRHMVMERHLNPGGNLFGGAVLGWLDEAAALFVMEKTGCGTLVTVSMEDVTFKAPAVRGDHIVIYTRIDHTGRSSVRVEARAYAYDPMTREQREIIDCVITYVCMRGNKAYPYFASDEFEQWRQRATTR